MNCKKCGSPLTENDQFCKNCGETVNSQSTNMGGQVSAGMSNDNNLSQQPMNANQPSYSNNMNQQQGWTKYNNTPNYNNQPMNKTGGNGKYIVIGFAILVAIIAIVVVIGMVVNKDNNSLTGGIQSSAINYKVSFKGFTFEIPDNLVYEEDNETLMIGNEEGSWVTLLELEQGSFSQLQANKNQLQSLMQQSGYTTSVASEKNLGGVEFITLEISASGQNAIVAFAKANSMYFIGVTVANQDNEFDYELLETIAPIVSSAQYTGATTNNISGNTKIDMSAISGLAN